ncbi:hypothetical protein VNI00_014711 [Paramarasmius palmivorus]|uniref:Uncharacterized protein n=1 Tax=Paramarasmius palmivorus TaxID=297713 RepID=A0AAW0BRP1_9AGAR
MNDFHTVASEHSFTFNTAGAGQPSMSIDNEHTENDNKFDPSNPLFSQLSTGIAFSKNFQLSTPSDPFCPCKVSQFFLTGLNKYILFESMTCNQQQIDEDEKTRELGEERALRQSAEQRCEQDAEEITELKRQAARLAQDKATLQDSNGKCASQLNSLQSQLDDLEQKHNQASKQAQENETLRALNEKYAQQLNVLQSELDGLKQDHDQASIHTQENVELRALNEDHAHQLDALQSELNSMKQKHLQEEALRGELEDKCRENIRIQMEHLVQEKETLQEANAKYVKEIESLMSQVDALGRASQSSTNDNSTPSHSPDIDPSNEQLQEAHRRVQELQTKLAEHINSMEETEVTIELQIEKIVALTQERDNALVDRDNAIRKWHDIRTSSNEMFTQGTQALETIQRLETQVKQLENDKEKLAEERDDYKKELSRLRARKRPKSSSSSSPGATTMQDTPEDADQEDEGLFSEESVKRIVDEALNRFSTTTAQPSSSSSQIPTESPPSGRKRKIAPKPGSRAYMQESKTSGFASVKSVEPEWRQLMRKIFVDRTGGVSGVNSYQDYIPVADDLAQNFDKGLGEGPKEATKYRLYFGEGWQKSRWNRQVVRDLIQEVVRGQAEARIPGECLSSEAIEACLWDYIKQAQVSWKRHIPRVHPTGNRFETTDEATLRSQIQEAERTQSLRANTRKSLKYKERKKGVQQILFDPSLSTMARRKWEFVEEVVTALGNDGQSSDETDEGHRDRPLVSSIPYYRRRIVSELLSELDTESRNLQRKINLAKGKRRMNPLRPRGRGTEKSTRTLARRLPEACYHRRFLRALDTIEKEGLAIRDSDLPFLNQMSQNNSDTENPAPEEMDTQ